MVSRTYILQEPGWRANDLPNAFRLDVGQGEPSALVVAYRCLTGSVDLQRIENEAVTRLRYDHLRRKRSVPSLRALKMAEDLFGEGVPLDKALENLDWIRSSNSSFFKKFCVEIIHACSNYSCGNYLESFLFLYRSVEKIAISFPLIYASRRADFEKVHSIFSKYYNKEKSGELSILKKFLAEISSISGDLSELTIDLKFDSVTEQRAEEIINTVKFIYGDHFPGVVDGLDVSIPYKDAADLVINIRNRMFHYTNSGQNNINIDNIGGASDICKIVVEVGLHWMSITMLEISSFSAMGR